MATALSKRQQARNERTLQELIKTVPGNSTCAECGARNPGWASWSLGIFLCMRCAALHRKLGTHISKVKSLSMDSWTNDQVENMKKTGNLASNRTFNPSNAKPPVPFDADEVDSAMERFIRQKYQEQGMGGGRPSQAPTRHYSGSTESDEHPPPLPPKTTSRFGFRSASSIFPMSSKAKREAAATAHLEAQRQNQRSPSPPLRNKPSRVFGSKVASDADDMEAKLAKLRAMGFSDDKRNSTVLKGLSGNLEKTVEALVRLGERSTSKSQTPLSTNTEITSGLTVERKREVVSPASSTNPWEMPPAPLQSSQSTGNVQARTQEQQSNGNPYHTSLSNPFGLAPSQSQYNLSQQYDLDQAFQNLSVGGQAAPLFPNHTGGFPNRQPYHPAGAPPPMPSIPQDYAPAVYDSQPQQQQNYNPFLQQKIPQQSVFNPTTNGSSSANPYSQQSPMSSNPYALQTQSPSSNPFGALQQSPTSYSPQQGYYDHSVQQQQVQQVQQPQPNTLYGQNQQMQPQQQPQQFQQHNPFNAPQFSQHQYGQLQQESGGFQQQQPLISQQTGRADKSSIMALFNYPQLARTTGGQSPGETAMDPMQAQTQLQNQNQQYPSLPSGVQLQPHNFSAPHAAYNSTLGAAGSDKNPFMMSLGGNNAKSGPMGNGLRNEMASGSGIGTGSMNMDQAFAAAQTRQVSRESVLVDMGWQGQNGRHSPDAFANLSARCMR